MVFNFDNTRKRLWEFIRNNKLQLHFRSLQNIEEFLQKGHGGKEFMF